MANGTYVHFYEELMAGVIDLSSHNFKAILVDTTGDGPGSGYTVNLATHQGLDDVLADDRIATGDAILGSLDVTGGVWDAADVVFTGVAGTVSVEAVIIYHDTPAADGDKTLIMYYDPATAGLAVTTNGGDINLNFNGSGILKLSP
jgi:hypothetical protein